MKYAKVSSRFVYGVSNPQDHQRVDLDKDFMDPCIVRWDVCFVYYIYYKYTPFYYLYIDGVTYNNGSQSICFKLDLCFITLHY